MEQAQAERPLRLSAQSVAILLDLIEIKLGAMDIEDRDDCMMGSLRRCRDELTRVAQAARAMPVRRGPGRPHKRL